MSRLPLLHPHRVRPHAEEHLIDLRPVLNLFALGLDPTVQTDGSLSSPLDHARALMPQHSQSGSAGQRRQMPRICHVESLIPE